MKASDAGSAADAQTQPLTAQTPKDLVHATTDSSPTPVETADFPIVALGASAGGLEALQRLFSRLPADPGLAFVVIQHMDPDRPSMLSHIIEGVTPLAVSEATDGVRLQPNRVVIIPPGADLTIQHGIVALVPREKTGNLHLPIDTFFRSLAEDRHGHAIAVVLSGSGADGREGLRAIKAEGGIAIAQEPQTAQFPSMPESAIAAGVVDFCGTPEEIAAELVRLGHHPYVLATEEAPTHPQALDPNDQKRLAAIFALLRRHAGVDFAGYKRTTILRRIERRMALRRAGTLEEYARLVRDDTGEARALAGEMLIHVTSFFRDEDAFAALKEQALRPLVERKADSDAIRIWVPGCSTGEEAYAITMCLLESLDELTRDCSVKVFGSDLSDQAIQVARRAVYSASAVVGVSPERLSRFFEQRDGEWRVGKQVRDLCVFARQDLMRDPPFARLDLISCRNVLIYFDAELQRRLIPTLHHCLNEQGYLFLGQSETISSVPELFAPVDRTHRIFMKAGDSPRLVYPVPMGGQAELNMTHNADVEPRRPAREAQRQADYFLLARYAPPAVVVNERLEIVQYRGRTGAYLEPPPGEPQANLLRMAREDLVAHLHEAIEHAKSQSATVRKEGLRIQSGSQVTEVSLEVVPLALTPGSTERYFLVLFDEAGRQDARMAARAAPSTAAERWSEDADEETERLHGELVATKDYVHTLISDHQTTTDDLATANEELIAANEELQSTNEELQSAKEELQSTNEELSTVNDQLESRNAELDRVANDLTNVLASVEIPVIIVDLELRVRRFTPTVRNIARFIPEDVGRPVDDVRLTIQVEDLPNRIREVINGLTPREWEVRGLEGRWFRMSIRPYRTADNRLDGAVLSFVDVNDLKRALEDAERARDYAKSIVETVSTALIVLDASARVVSANDGFYERFGLSEKAVEGQRLFELGAGVWERGAVREALDQMLTRSQAFSNLEFTADLPVAGHAVLSLTGRPIPLKQGHALFLLALEDVTALRTFAAERANLLEAEKQARLDAERANRAKDLFLATLSHELRTPLSAMLLAAHVLSRATTEDQKIQRAGAAIERSARSQARLIDDLLDVSRIVSGKLLLDLGPVDLAPVVHEAVDAARPSAEAKNIDLALAVDGAIGFVYGDAGRLQQVVSNLLTNALKFTPHGGAVSVRLERIGGRAQLTVADTGMGIRPDVLPHLFNRFVQADSSVTRTHGGLGLGLSIVRHLVEVHEGSVQVESPGEGQGATFRVTLPLGSASAMTARSSAAVARSIEGVRILVVEDDEDTREGYVSTLGDLGAVVRAESSASAGLVALEGFRPHLILCDIAMPGEDGFSFIERVRRLGPERGGQVPAAAITALASDHHWQQALRSGFQMHVAKPIDAARLAAVVRRLADWKPLSNGSAPEQGAGEDARTGIQEGTDASPSEP